MLFRDPSQNLRSLFRKESYQVDLIGEFRLALDKGRSVRAYAEQQLSSVTADQWEGNLFKGFECAFLAWFDIDKLGNVDHKGSKIYNNPGIFML